MSVLFCLFFLEQQTKISPVLLFVPDLKSRRNLSFSEDSDLSCDDVLERSSQKSKADVSNNGTTSHIFVICRLDMFSLTKPS